MKKTIKPEVVGREGTVLLEAIRRLNRRKAVAHLLKLIDKTHPADIAWVLRYLTPEERHNVFNVIAQTDQIGEILSELDQSIMLELVDDLPPKFMVTVLKKMASNDAADLLEALPVEVADNIRQLMARADREEVDDLLQYNPESAGGLMSPNFMALHEDLSVDEAIRAIQERSEDLEMVFYLYIVRENNQLTGVLSLRELLMHPPYRQLKNIMNPKVIAVNPETDQEEVAHMVSRYNILAVPVVNHAGKLLGIVTVDDVIDVIRKEATEDFFQMAGAGKDDEILMKSIRSNAVTRAPWLCASWVGGVVSATIIALFSGELQKYVILASFLPIINGMGGNIANQSSTIIVRGIATGRVNLEEVFKIVFKEMKVGMLLGGIYGLFLALVVFLALPNPSHLFLVASISVVLEMTLAASIGAFVPLVMKKMGFDAAVATGPFVATTMDIIGTTTFFTTAILLLN
ncbi:Mg/Co/Ni transporter MgtE, CBS domain-containing [hydrothermal vent metagenome]|uniref:Mg/Co/Ni transporter MgtE, CBS domain-containing n=1 Tax=hydrothermal vent metagenome TaxID=652676 RepID=A0A3B0W7E1_9ZZZZ